MCGSNYGYQLYIHHFYPGWPFNFSLGHHTGLTVSSIHLAFFSLQNTFKCLVSFGAPVMTLGGEPNRNEHPLVYKAFPGESSHLPEQSLCWPREILVQGWCAASVGFHHLPTVAKEEGFIGVSFVNFLLFVSNNFFLRQKHSDLVLGDSPSSTFGSWVSHFREGGCDQSQANLLFGSLLPSYLV